MKSPSCVQLLATAWTAAYQAPLPMGLSRQEYWSGVPLPSPTYLQKNTVRPLPNTIYKNWGFPGGASGKEPACPCRRPKRLGFNPGLARSPGEGNGNPLQYSCLRNPMDKRSLVGFGPWHWKKLNKWVPHELTTNQKKSLFGTVIFSYFMQVQ